MLAKNIERIKLTDENRLQRSPPDPPPTLLCPSGGARTARGQAVRPPSLVGPARPHQNRSCRTCHTTSTR